MNTLVVSESLFSKMLVSMPLITLRRSITDNYQYFIRVHQTVEKILTSDFDVFISVANRINGILIITSKFMLTEMAQASS